jgi:hypothetical protein
VCHCADVPLGSWVRSDPDGLQWECSAGTASREVLEEARKTFHRLGHSRIRCQVDREANTLVAVLSSDSTCLNLSGSLVIGEDHTV